MSLRIRKFPEGFDASCLTDPDSVIITLAQLSQKVGMPKIGPRATLPFAVRVMVYESMFGAMRSFAPAEGEEGPATPVFFTPDEIKRYAGLETNVEADSDARFRINMIERLWTEKEKAAEEFVPEYHFLDEKGEVVKRTLANDKACDEFISAETVKVYTVLPDESLRIIHERTEVEAEVEDEGIEIPLSAAA